MSFYIVSYVKSIKVTGFNFWNRIIFLELHLYTWLPELSSIATVKGFLPPQITDFITDKSKEKIGHFDFIIPKYQDWVNHEIDILILI